MRPAWVLGLGALACGALLAITRIWLPYVDGGPDTGPALQHLAATGVVAVFYALLAGYIALSREAAGATGRIVTATWIGLAALLSTLALAGTDAGLSYRVFWTLVVLQALLLAILWIVASEGRHAPAVARETAARVRLHRRERIVQELSQFQARIAAGVGAGRPALAQPLARLIEELRLFPAHADGVSADRIERDLLQWSSRLAGLHPAAVDDDAAQQQLAWEARALQDRLASWKRT